MATLDQLKALFPDAASDSDVIKKAAAEFGISPADIASEVGVKISSPGMWTSVKRGVGQVESALGSTARDLGLERAGRALEAYGEDVAFRNPSGINTVGEAISSPWLTTKEALGELAPQLGASVATGIGGRVVGGVLGLPFGPAGVAIGQNIGAGAGAYLGNLAQEYGGIRSEQREKGIEDKTRALGAGATAAALDTALGAERLVNKIGNKGLNILSREAGEKLPTHVLKQAGLGAVGEAGTEAVQTALERFGAYKELTGAEALNEYGLAAIKGGLGGGIVRGGLSAVAGQRESTSLIPDTNQGAAPTAQGAPANDISQAFQANDRTTPDSIMSGLMGRAADPLAGRSSLYGQQAPAVVGGTTDIAQAQQQAQAESQQIQAAQAQQAAREQIYTEYGIADPQNPTKGNLFGKPLFGRNVPAVADAIATATQTMTPYQLELAQAVNKANAETGGKLLNFQFNANDPAKSVQKAFEAVGKVAVGFQIADVQSAQEAAQILDEQSNTLSGTKLEQLNAIHYALTGEDTSGYIAAQQSKAEKGAKDGKLQLQTTTGLGTVPVEGGAGEANAGGAGLVRPAQVQPIGAAGLGEGSLGLQTGQPPAGGVRAGTGADTSVGDGQPTQNAQVNGQAQAAVSGAPQVTTERQTDENLGTVPSVQQEQAIEEQQVEGVPGLIRNVLRMIYKSDRKIDLLLRLTEKSQRTKYAQLAKEYGLSEQYVSELGSDATTDEGQPFPRFIMQNIDKFLAAVNTQAEQSGMSLLDALDALQVIHDAYEGGEAAQLGTQVDEADLVSAGLAIQDREARVDKTGKKTGKSDLTNVTNIVDEADYRDRASQAYLAEMDRFEKDPSEENQARLDAVTAAASAKSKSQAEALYKKYQKLKGDKDAVQEQSTDEGNVREPAGGGEAVGEGNAKPQKPARKAKQTKAVVKPTETPPQVKTPAEQWAELADQFPGMPPYESLTPDEKTRWDDLAGRGVANLAAASRLLEGAVTTRAAEVPSTAGTDEKVEETRLASKSKSFFDANELADDFDGVNAAIIQLDDMGIGHAMDYVSDWETINDPSEDAINGEIISRGGRYKVVLNEAKLTSSDHATETVTHEVGHAIDMAPHGGIYSSQPEMSVVVENGKITPVGAVAREMHNLYKTDAGWAEYLEYPFDTVKFKDLNNHVVIEGELFAQVFSVYVNPRGRAKLEKIAPQTAAFMAEVIKHVQSTRSLQVQTAPTQAARSLAFRNRNTGAGGQTRVNPLQRREETERLASRSASFSQGLDNYLPPAVAKPAKSVVTNLAAAARNGLLSAGITEDIVNMAKKYMRSAGDYLDAQYARQKTRLEFEMRIERIEEAFERLPKELQGTGANSVNRYILDSTMQRKWGYYPGEHRIGTELFEVDPDLEKRFDAFPPEAQKVIRDVFEHGYTALKLKQSAVSKAVEREFAEREKAAIGDADMLDQLQKERKEMVARLTRLQNIDFTTPYAYLGRYGDYVVVSKSKEFKHWEERAKLNDFDREQAQGWLAENVSNPDHYVVQFAESQGEADQIASELIATGKYDMDGTEAGPKEDVGSYIGSDVHLAVARLRNLADRQQGEGSEELDKLLSDLYLLTAAENSARKSEFMRKYVSGADANMMRNLATSGRADAHFLSTMEHNDDVTDAMERMRDEARSNRRDAMPLYNELFKRQAQSLDYNQPSVLSQALTQTSAVWFLATSPAFYLQQILQTSVLSLPYMSGRLGYFRSVRAVKAAYADVAELVKGVGIGEHIDFSKAPADVRQMLQTLVGMGKIDIGIDSDTKARANEQGPAGKVMRKLQNLNSRIEAVNRSTAAIAAYRGYIQRYGNNPDAATKYAAEVVSNTHGSYDGFNTPRILNSDVGRVVGQFKRFQIIQLSMLGKLISNAFKGASAEEKAIARRSLAFIGGHMAVLGGALGVPFVQQIGALISKLLGDEDEPDDLEYKLRQMIGDKTMADLLLNGVPAALGVNLGGKLGMGNVASILPFTDVDLSSRSGYEKVLVGLMGPFFGGLAPKFADGAGMIAKGEYYKGLELLAPNGIGNAMKGLRFANEGVTMRNGDVVLKPEEISMLDAAFQAVGLPTTTITGRQYAQRKVAEFDKFYSDRAAEIKGAYVNASREGDTEGMADARQEWQNLQDSRRRNGYKIQPMSELFKATVAARKREASVVGGVETNKGNKQFAANLI